MSFSKQLTHLALLYTCSTAVQAWNGPGPTACMTEAQATQVANFWPALIGNYTKTLAQEILAENYTDYSESALSLNQVCPQVSGAAPPLTAPVFTSRQQFEEGQGSQPAIDSQVLNIWPACTTVTLRYNMTNLGTRPVITVVVIEAIEAPSSNKYPWIISDTFSEFDSEAWMQNLKDANKC